MTQHREGSLRERLERALEFTSTDAQLAEWLVETGTLEDILAACTCTADEAAELLGYASVRSFKTMVHRRLAGKPSRVPLPVVKGAGDLWSRPEVVKAAEPQRVYASFRLPAEG